MLTNIIDTHAHYDDPYFLPEISTWVDRLKENGIRSVITSGSEIPSSFRSVDLAEKHDLFYASVGIYPNEYRNVPADYIDTLRELAACAKTVAIGEIGLDYGFDPHCDRNAQAVLFEQQLELACELDMPIVIHDRDADEDVLRLVRKYRPRGVVHRVFSKPVYSRQFMELGICMGIGPQITYANAGRLWEIVKDMPLELLMLETDAPFIPTYSHKGEMADSIMIAEVVTKIAEIRGDISPQEVIDIATENTISMFGIT